MVEEFDSENDRNKFMDSSNSSFDIYDSKKSLQGDSAAKIESFSKHKHKQTHEYYEDWLSVDDTPMISQMKQATRDNVNQDTLRSEDQIESLISFILSPDQFPASQIWMHRYKTQIDSDHYAPKVPLFLTYRKQDSDIMS